MMANLRPAAIGGGKSFRECLYNRIFRSGNVYTIGKVLGTNDFDPGAGIYNLTLLGAWHIFISKLDAAGNFIRAKNIRVGDEDVNTAMAIDDVGNVFTTGSFYYTVEFDPGPSTYSLTAPGFDTKDIFVSKLDPSGNFVWAKNMGGPGHDEGYFISS